MKMKKIIFLMGVLLLVSLVMAENSPFYYKISLSYDANADEYLQIQSVNVIYSTESLEFSEGDFTIRLEDREGAINDYLFYIPNLLTRDQIDEVSGEFTSGEIIHLDNVNFTLYIPYREKATIISLYNESELIDGEDISRFSRDYQKNEGQKNETDVQTIITLKAKEKKSSFIFLTAAIIGVLVLFIVVLYTLRGTFK